jgi:hypothetical protein
MKFHENPSGGGHVFLCGQMDGWTSMTRLVVAFRDYFNNGPKMFAGLKVWNT